MTRLLARALHEGGVVGVELRGAEAALLQGADADEAVLQQAPATSRTVAASALRLLAPVRPSKVVAVALNYRAHALEMKKPLPPEPLYFIKPATTVIGPGDAIRLPPQSAEVHHEAEVALVVGRRLTRATPAQARESLLGVTCLNDVTARDIQRRTGHFSVSKTFDTFCPLGPAVACGLAPDDLGVRLRVNGETRQEGRTSDLIFDVWHLLSVISGVMTLLPGDVVSTGTPPGVGQLRAGDVVEVEVEGVGVLSNPVEAGA